LEDIQGKVKQEMVEVKEKIIDLTSWTIKDIETKMAVVFKEVEVAKASSQHFISAWKNKKKT
jgi:hypothetical protein